MSRLSTCLNAAAAFLLGADRAKAIIARQLAVIQDRWPSVCDEAGLQEADRRLLWRRQFLNPFAFADAPGDLAIAD